MRVPEADDPRVETVQKVVKNPDIVWITNTEISYIGSVISCPDHRRRDTPQLSLAISVEYT